MLDKKKLQPFAETPVIDSETSQSSLIKNVKTQWGSIANFYVTMGTKCLIFIFFHLAKLRKKIFFFQVKNNCYVLILFQIIRNGQILQLNIKFRRFWQYFNQNYV